MKRALIALFIAFAVTGGLFAAPLSGEIIYMEGSVDIYRDGKQLDWRQVDIGFYLQPYDTLETGSDGVAELDIVTAGGSSAVVNVKPGTAFYLTEESVQGTRQNSFTMMKGSLSFRVQKLAGRESVNVRTETAVMGVRGTNFDVETSPEGGVLVLCNEGAVEVSDPQGRSAMAKPGQVVQNVPESELSVFAVQPDELGMYRDFWVSSRMEVFKNGADTFIRGYARQYQDFSPRFNEAYRQLSANRSLLERYGKNPGSSSGTLFQVKSKVSPGVIRMRSVLPMFEQVFYRLEVLSSYHREGFGRTSISSGLTSSTFFTRFDRDLSSVKLQLADVRYLFKLFQEIDAATGGGASGLMDSPFSNGGSGGFGGGMPSGSPPSGGSLFEGNRF
jgi:hypothetical protein